MNIQGANLLSLLSGSENLGNLQQGLSGLTGDQAGFASALMEQLGMLNGGNASAPDLTAIQNLMSGADGDLQQGLQNFAATLGQKLPVANKGSQDIDLEDTLQTLSEVLQQLQQLDTDSVDTLVAPVSEQIETRPETEDTAALTDIEQAEQTAAVMLSNPVVTPVALPQDDLQAATDNIAPTGLLLDAKKPAPVLSQETKGQIEAVNVNADDASLEFDRSINAMMAHDEASSKQQQEKSAQTFKSENLAAKLADAAPGVETNKIDGDKSVPDIAGDISRMNQVVRNTATVSAPTSQAPALIKHFNDPGWHQELGDKLVWMHNQSIPSVELRLNPEHLGPVLVKIDVSQDQATVAFTAQHLAVKEAIEAAIPKLREMLGGQQLNLVDVNVSQQQSDQKQAARDFFQMASEQGQRGQSNVDNETKGAVNEAQHIVDEIEAGRAIASNGLLSLFA